jgi:hypothetical protein
LKRAFPKRGIHAEYDAYSSAAVTHSPHFLVLSGCWIIHLDDAGALNHHGPTAAGFQSRDHDKFCHRIGTGHRVTPRADVMEEGFGEAVQLNLPLTFWHGPEYK